MDISARTFWNCQNRKASSRMKTSAKRTRKALRIRAPRSGLINGYVEAYKDLFSGKSNEIGRSYGFFVYVLGRLITLRMIISASLQMNFDTEPLAVSAWSQIWTVWTGIFSPTENAYATALFSQTLRIFYDHSLTLFGPLWNGQLGKKTRAQNSVYPLQAVPQVFLVARSFNWRKRYWRERQGRDM